MEKENTKVYPKEAEEPFLAENKHKILKCGQKRTLHGGPMMAFRRVGVALTSQIKAQARIISRTNAKESTKKEKGKGEAHHQSGLSASEAPEE